MTGGTGDSFPDSAPGGRRRSGHTRNPRHAAVPEPLGPLHVPAADDILAAIGIHQRTGISFWDAMIVRSAAALGCDTILSEDLNAGQRYDGVLVVDPFVSPT